MHYTGTVWRPPFEFRSLLLQVTTGCSHNGCSFCSMYRKTPFRVSPMEEVRADLEEAARHFPETERVFLLSGDAFVLPAERLLEIAEEAHKALPKLKTISCYASVQNVKNKTVPELKALRAAGINEPNFGIETGLPDLLKAMNKGFTLEEAREQLGKLREAGMDFSANLILGGAALLSPPGASPAGASPPGVSPPGASPASACQDGGMYAYLTQKAGAYALLEEKAAADASLMNELRPSLIFVTTLHGPGEGLRQPAGGLRQAAGGLRQSAGGPLREAIRDGQSGTCKKEDILREEILLLEKLDLQNTVFLGIHISDPVPVAGMLPWDKAAMIEKLRNALLHCSPDGI